MTLHQFEGTMRDLGWQYLYLGLGFCLHSPDIGYGRGAREGVRANEFVDHVWHASLVKPEVPWLLHDLLRGTPSLFVQGRLYRSHLREVALLCPCQSWLTAVFPSGTLGKEFCLDHFASLVEFILINNSRRWCDIEDCLLRQCWQPAWAGEALWPGHVFAVWKSSALTYSPSGLDGR